MGLEHKGRNNLKISCFPQGTEETEILLTVLSNGLLSSASENKSSIKAGAHRGVQTTSFHSPFQTNPRPR